jgi:hypothetical protein
MPRQRVHIEGSRIAVLVGQALTAVLGAALVFYGVMVVMLAFKVSPDTVNSISGYRSAFDYLAGLEASDIDGTDRAIIAAAGVVAFLVAAFLVWRGLPRPRLARHSVVIATADDGETEVQPRAFERVVESAAREDGRVTGARARYDEDGLVLAIDVKDAVGAVDTLRATQERALESLRRHELEVERVDVTLAGYNGTNRRELA